jgi:hypothetical protein
MPNIKIQRTAEVMLSERIEILAAADLGVGPSRCTADSTAQVCHQAVYTPSLNTIADPAPSPTGMPAQHQLHSF